MKSAFVRLITFAAVALSLIALPASRAADTTYSNPSLAPLAEKGFKVITGTSVVTVKFRAVIPLASNAVIDAITFPARISGAGNYSGHSAIVGKTLTAGVEYPIFGDSIQLDSGSCIVILR